MVLFLLFFTIVPSYQEHQFHACSSDCNETCNLLLQTSLEICGSPNNTYCVTQRHMYNECRSILKILHDYEELDDCPSTSLEYSLLHSHPCREKRSQSLKKDAGVAAAKSCIARRSDCLKDYACSMRLTDYRRTCREKKRKEACLADDHSSCLKSIAELESSGLFNCTCPMRKKKTLDRCMHIFNRLANNTCLVDAPYYVFSLSMEFKGGTFNDLADFIGLKGIPDGSCTTAFRECHHNRECRARLGKVYTTCSKCSKREDCLKTIKVFTSSISVQVRRPLLFCRCPDEGDRKCLFAKNILRPSCVRVTKPKPIGCEQLVEKCENMEGCGKTLAALDEFCGDADLSAGRCSIEKCRDAIEKTMGTLLMTNCTCYNRGHSDVLSRCVGARKRLFGKSTCKELAFSLGRVNGSTVAPPHVKVVSDECQKFIASKVPPYMSVPKYVRKYKVSNCGDLCTCHPNGSLSCNTLRCSRESIKKKCIRNGGYQYDSGTSFSDAVRGQCRCIRGETVCARPRNFTATGSGLFFQLGISVEEKRLLGDDIYVDAYSIMDKLVTIINRDGPKECWLKVLLSSPSNFVYSIKPREATCSRRVRFLLDAINQRKSIILMDAELSLIKIAEMKKIIHRTPPTRSIERSPPERQDDNSTTSVNGSFSLLLILTSIGYFSIYLFFHE